MANREMLADDAVEYRLFPHIPEDCCRDEVEQYLGEQVEIYTAHLSTFLVDYIWQNESFHIRALWKDTYSENIPPHLYGVTHFGDNIDDEWFIVYLLRHLCEEFPGLVVQINDNDGEFLLIEAAQSLPKWVKPETTENRVFLYEGLLHLIPPPETPAEIVLLPTGLPTLEQAVNSIRGNPNLTMATADVQKDIMDRLEGYPEKAAEMTHHTHCYVPAPLAAVLDNTPSLVAPMVQSFYYRDPIDLKSCLTFRHFQPGTRVMRRIRLTRCLYAQLLQQKFTPDKRSGFTIPPPSNPKHRAYDVGVKLAHGAEILCSKCGTTQAGVDPMTTVTSDPRWDRYVATLDAKGYFKGQLEGSELYNKLLLDAKKYFLKSFENKESGTPDSPGQQILQVLKRVHYDIEDMRKEEKSLKTEDDDGWMNISSEELDAMLEKAAGKPVRSGDLGHMTQGVQAFVNKVSGLEGAELPKADACEIQFDPNSFMQSMQKVFDFDDSDDVSSSDLSEYSSDDELEDYSKSRSPTKSPTKPHSKHQSHGVDDKPADSLGLQHYMDLMDRELAKTTIGESFEKGHPQTEKNHPVAPPRKKRQTHAADSSNSSSNQSSPQHTQLGSDPNTSSTQEPTSPQKSSSWFKPTFSMPAFMQKPKSANNPSPTQKSNPTHKSSSTHKSSPTQPKGAAPTADMEEDDLYDVDDLDDDFTPVNVNLNLVKNLMESYGSQSGVAGPASNLLGGMGIRLPQDKQ